MRRPRQKCRRSRGLQALADRDSLDWKDYDADTIFKRVTEHLQPGSIVLFHNAALHTPEALPSILEYMHQNGYTVVPIGSLIYTESYTIDHAGRQSPVQTEAGTSPAPNQIPPHNVTKEGPSLWPLLPFSPKACLIRKAQEDRPSVFRPTVSKAFFIASSSYAACQIDFLARCVFLRKNTILRKFAEFPSFHHGVGGPFPLR